MEEKNSYLSADPETIRQIDEKMPPEEELQDQAEFFKVWRCFVIKYFVGTVVL